MKIKISELKSISNFDIYPSDHLAVCNSRETRKAKLGDFIYQDVEKAKLRIEELFNEGKNVAIIPVMRNI